MNVTLRTPVMTREEFFDWAEARGQRYEFDGFEPVAMTGGSVNHSRIVSNLNFALRFYLGRSGCETLGPDAGIATVGNSVRYPDALVTCTKTPGEDRLVQDPLVVFEVLSPTSGRIDRIDKLLEYRAVPSILRYVILEYRSAAATVFARVDGQADWTAKAVTAAGMIPIPEVGIELPMRELYVGVDLPDAETSRDSAS